MPARTDSQQDWLSRELLLTQVLPVCWRGRQGISTLPAVKRRYYNWHPSCVPALVGSWLHEQREGRAQIREMYLAEHLACFFWALAWVCGILIYSVPQGSWALGKDVESFYLDFSLIWQMDYLCHLPRDPCGKWLIQWWFPKMPSFAWQQARYWVFRDSWEHFCLKSLSKSRSCGAGTQG